MELTIGLNFIAVAILIGSGAIGVGVGAQGHAPSSRSPSNAA